MNPIIWEPTERTMRSVSNKKRILFVMNHVPYPLRAHGVSVRYLPIFQYLSGSHVIDLIVINGLPEELCHVENLKQYCRKVSVIPDPRRVQHGMFDRWRTYTNYLIPWTPPLTMIAHNGEEVSRAIVAIAGKDEYEVLVWVGSYLLPNMMNALPSMSAGKVVVDFIDSPFLFATRAKKGTFRIPFLERYELWKTCRWEGKVIREADTVIYISRVDAEAVPPELAPTWKRHVIPNGVNVPSTTGTDIACLPSPTIGFLGNMLYPPNVEAVEWLYEKVFVPLRKDHPSLTLVVIGRDPAPSVLRLGREPGVIVTGTVEDVWAYIGGVDVFLFPLLRGAGLKNKILEVMYAGRPVVTTEIGNEGVDATDGHDLVICRTPEDFRREAIRLLRSPEERMRIGEAAHAFVKAKFSWDAILRDYESLVLKDGKVAGGDKYLPVGDISTRA